jgi:acyl-CoA reductase-like NAD-dependent aldehyde dehydrogenase
MNKSFKLISPIDNSLIDEIAYTTQLQMQTIIDKSKAAQIVWSQININDRMSIIQRFIDLTVENKDTIGEQITRQMGRPLQYSSKEVLGMKERAEYLLSCAKDALCDIKASEDTPSFMRKTPLGTILIIAPWNYPLLTAINAIVPALLSGNSVILKHSHQTPWCGDMFQQYLEKAGLPKGVLNNVYLSHEATQDLIQNEVIDFVCFTGSVNAGRHIQKAIGTRFINSTLELGGKDAAYVRADADIETTITNLVDGSFFNSGQSCCGIERIYVAKQLFNDFIDGFVNQTYAFKLGNPLELSTTLGPMVSSKAAKLIREEKEFAISQGARALVEEDKFSNFNQDSAYVTPQVFIDVDHKMRLMREENFGPIVGIMAVDSDEHAMQLINDSHYGLTAGIWTKDIEQAIQLGNLAQVGTWFINRCDYLDPALAWTGVKDTGKGLSLSRFCFDAMTRLKSFNLPAA